MAERYCGSLDQIIFHARKQVILASWFPDLIGKNPTAILSTDDCQGTYEELKERGVTFIEAPQPRPFGVQAIFQDLYGNRYALLQPGKGRSLSASPE